MYGFVLAAHSIIRWLVVLAGILAVGRALIGWLGKRPWNSLDNRLGVLFTTSLDIQFLVGLLLYFFLSPLTTSALTDFGNAMGNPIQRYFAVEHVSLMLVSVILAHVGRSLSKKAATSDAKHQRAAIFFLLAFVVLMLAIPWPFLPTGRPWLRF